MSTQIYAGHSTNAGSASLLLQPGAYQLVSHLSPSPRVGATEPPTSLPNDGLILTDAAGKVVRAGPGTFAIVDMGEYTLNFGLERRVNEVWQLDPKAAPLVRPAVLPPAKA